MNIKYFEVKNFFSLKEEVIIELDNKLDKELPFPAHPVMGIAGSNASGKTNVLKALSFPFRIMSESFLQMKAGDLFPFETFISQKNEPTSFAMVFTAYSADGTLIEYSYELTLTRNEILFEELYYSPTGRKRMVFSRTGNNVEFGSTISKVSLKDLRSNASFISYAVQFESQKELKELHEYCGTFGNVGRYGLEEDTFTYKTLQTFLKDDTLYKTVLSVLKLADIGITGFNVSDVSDEEELINRVLKDKLNTQQFSEDELSEIKEVLFSDRSAKSVFHHNIDGDDFIFSEDMESSGTLQLLTLFKQIVGAMLTGGTIILDEIEIKLHPDLVAYLIGLFQSPTDNPRGAQLIFSFHNTLFMDFLTPDQLWFAEKDDEGRTEVFSAADFKDIRDLRKKSLEKLYRLGRFGASPRSL